MLGISCSQIKNRVRRLVGKYRTTDPYELCECMGIILSDENFGESETAIKAMTMTIARTTIIQLNSSLDEVVHKFITAHELGHAVLHKNMRHIDNGFFDDLSRTEREANLFAAELIFGDSRKLFEYMQYSEQTLFQLAAEKQVPYELLAYKLEIMKEEGFDVP
ncbi:MAG: ImmA/IrrE family metallo-endopeptidase, partial [Oscillospiraceae bacterium]|nr:ImmA/IrrE family metallo-endopeptidase [Oscillospiraceae bacterium]